eukprot:2358104-Alexandrium_andersonii.AAC.1
MPAAHTRRALLRPVAGLAAPAPASLQERSRRGAYPHSNLRVGRPLLEGCRVRCPEGTRGPSARC